MTEQLKYLNDIETWTQKKADLATKTCALVFKLPNHTHDLNAPSTQLSRHLITPESNLKEATMATLPFGEGESPRFSCRNDN